MAKRRDHLTVWQAITFLWHIKSQNHYKRIHHDPVTNDVYCDCGAWRVRG